MPSSQNKKRPSVRRGAFQKAQIETPSCPDSHPEFPHLSTSKLNDQMAKHLIGALVMKSLIQLERGHFHGA